MVVSTIADKIRADRIERNKALSNIGEPLMARVTKGAAWSETKPRTSIRGAVGDWGEFVSV